MIGLSRDTVKVVTYQPEWAELFRQEAIRLRSALGSAIGQIEHVGSTSVPGMMAKPVIDMIAAVESRSLAGALVPALQRLGYEHRPDNPVPGRIFFALGPRTCRTHHLSLVEATSTFWQEHIAFRDCLLVNRQVAEDYAALKRRLAVQFSHDRRSYTAAKEDFIAHVLSMLATPNTALGPTPVTPVKHPRP